MKILMKPVEMIAVHAKEGGLRPYRFRYLEGEGHVTIQVKRVVTTTREKINGRHTLVFRCESVIRGMMRPYELKYDVEAMQWYLYKL
jgi:hypothetical protein